MDMISEHTFEDWAKLSQEISKQQSALGINLSNIRPSGATISSSAPTGVSSMISSFDVASMYPYQSSGSYKLEDPSYHVANDYPFEVKRMTMSEMFALGDKWVKNSIGFARRYDAEKQSLEQLCQWSNGDWEEDLRNKKKLETFDEDHPEWLL